MDGIGYTEIYFAILYDIIFILVHHIGNIAVNMEYSKKLQKQLDKLDRQILFELDCNSRISFSDLAKKVRNGRDTVEYRVSRLIERQIIRSFTVAINHYRLGFQVYSHAHIK
jgi:predicted transcriptional regulator